MNVKNTGNILTKSQIKRQFSQTLLNGHQKLSAAIIAVNTHDDAASQRIGNDHLDKVEKRLSKLFSKRGLSAKDKITGIQAICRLSLSQKKGLALVDLCIDNHGIIFATGGSDEALTYQNHFARLCLNALEQALIDQRKDLMLTKVKLASVLRALENIVEAVLAIGALTERPPLQKFEEVA